MIFQQSLIDFQANVTRNANITPEISEQDIKNSRWNQFCHDEQIQEMFYNVDIKQLNELHAFGKTQIYQWLCSQKKNIIFYGGPGSGKTHSGLALLRYFYEKKLWVRHLHDYQIPEKGKNLGVNYLKEIYGGCDRLMIDDFGLGSVPEWEVPYYFSILDMRFNQSKPTIITTNLNESELEKKFTKRILSRLPADWVKFEDVDNRIFGF